MSHADGEQLLTYNLSEVSTAVFNYGYKIDGVFGRVAKQPNPYVVPIYKLRHLVSGNRLFTASQSEYYSAINNYGYTDEFIGFHASPIKLDNNYIGVYRLQKGAYHRYAMSELERDLLMSPSGGGWTLELNGLPAFYMQATQIY